MQARQETIRRSFQSVAAGLLTAAGLAAFAAEPSAPASAQGEMLLTDGLGQVVKTPVDSVPEGLRLSSAIGLKHQTPHTHKGTPLTSEVLDKLQALWAERPQFEFFPAVPPPLMSYLYSNDEFGNTAIRPGGAEARRRGAAVVQ